MIKYCIVLFLAFIGAGCAQMARSSIEQEQGSHYISQPLSSVSPFEGLEHLFTEPRHYVAHFTDTAPAIDGHLDDEVWQQAVWTDLFTDIEGDTKPAPSYLTRVKMAWDNTYLYIAAELKDPHVWATLTEHDEVVFHDNDFEVFIDPDNDTHQYFEVEVNALNTIFDLFMSKPYRNNNGALIAWDMHGLKSAVQVQGTLNNTTDTDEGWTVEMAIPFRSVTIGNHTKVPQEGTLWRINFSRVQWDVDVEDGRYVKRKAEDGKPLPEHNWVWSPQGVVNMHLPERWGYLYFTRKAAGNSPVAFSLPHAERQKQYLWLVYYRQKEYFGKHGRYSQSLKELGLESSVVQVEGQENRMMLEAGTLQFMAAIQGTDGQVWGINENGFVHKIKGLL
ncbi:carbohydrate-binding family 9-like protein [Pontibacter ramchanderi]|uniref:Carbohydrate binding protein with CBM9 domain n=1 Tax=Pontibacter ramchanderi TaxID=1179743 RepID=A0A2N3U890_9BACT|nr:carbohydrate-binding family 9-like protein [Pontibacter ramchanderi]PKV62935.1 carbohydrate binding protein with CBM9 domain [Pontibacter ramchanderi]